MRKARAFVPKMTIRHAAAGVLPACALAAMTELSACDHKQVIALAMMAFDAGIDGATSAVTTSTASTITPDADSSVPPPPPSPHVIVLAAVGFDSAP